MTPSLKIADSEFIGFVKPISCKSDAVSYVSSLKREYPSAAHIPYGWMIKSEFGYEEDGEPPDSVGPILLQELKILPTLKDGGSYAIVVVRHFQRRLLGVTCGRLSQCYRSIAALTLHRHFNGGAALHQDFTEVAQPLNSSKYGLGAGDCELIPNIIDDVEDVRAAKDDDPGIWTHRIVSELEFGGFRGNANEELPRLQNLQADISGGIVPAYRYPGNYRGDEWETYQWSPLSFKIKKAVEKNLKPLVDQEMNHCVTNCYRNGNDFIGHHSDKDLDLDKDGVIISVSLGDERILELKQRAPPHDTIKIVLPHGSMLVLGPYTNKFFTHSILMKKGSSQPRISLTFRRVLTHIDLNSGRLFGEGVSTTTLSKIQNHTRIDDIWFLGAITTITSALFHRASQSGRQNIRVGIVSTGLLGLSYASFKKIRLILCKRKEENEARAFFSRASVHGTKY